MARFLALLLSLFIAPGYGAAANGASPPPDTVAIKYQAVKRERLLDGIVEAVNQSTASAQTSGRVVEINFDVDDFVKAGDILLRISDTEQRASVARAEAALSRARSRLAQARTHFERIKSLRARNTVSQAEYDTAEADLKAAEAQMLEATAALDQAREQLKYTVVRAPYGGIVTERHVELGETVSPGTPLMSGFSLNRLRVRVEVPSRLLNTIRRHDRARVLIPGDEQRSVEATEITYFPFAHPDSNTITVRAELPEKTGGIYPGMLVKAAFAMGERQQLSIPADSVVYRSEVVGTYVMGDDGRVRLRHIRVGNELPGGAIEVLAGLEEGELVVQDPLAALAWMREQAAPANALENGGKGHE